MTRKIVEIKKSQNLTDGWMTIDDLCQLRVLMVRNRYARQIQFLNARERFGKQLVHKPNALAAYAAATV